MGFPRRAGILLSGIPNHEIEDVRLENINLVFPGGGTGEEASRLEVPERAGEYPEFPAFGTLPSWGLYLRHMRNIVLNGVRLQTSQPDARPPIVTDRVRDLVMQDVVANGQKLSAS